MNRFNHHSRQFKVSVDNVNPQTENENRPFNFTEHEPAMLLEGWKHE
jgi:hypothetical protein